MKRILEALEDITETSVTPEDIPDTRVPEEMKKTSDLQSWQCTGENFYKPNLDNGDYDGEYGTDSDVGQHGRSLDLDTSTTTDGDTEANERAVSYTHLTLPTKA